MPTVKLQLVYVLCLSFSLSCASAPYAYRTEDLSNSTPGITCWNLQLGKTLATGNSGTAVVHHSFLCILCEDTFAATFAGRSDCSRSVASPENFQGTTGMCICVVCCAFLVSSPCAQSSVFCGVRNNSQVKKNCHEDVLPMHIYIHKLVLNLTLVSSLRHQSLKMFAIVVWHSSSLVNH